VPEEDRPAVAEELLAPGQAVEAVGGMRRGPLVRPPGGGRFSVERSGENEFDECMRSGKCRTTPKLRSFCGGGKYSFGTAVALLLPFPSVVFICFALYIPPFFAEPAPLPTHPRWAGRNIPCAHFF